MSNIAAVLLPNGLLQAFWSSVTLWETSATSWNTPSSFYTASNFLSVAACITADGLAQVWGIYENGKGQNFLVTRKKESTAPGAHWTPWAQISSIPANLTNLCAAQVGRWPHPAVRDSA
jgi:hypothetical protein